MSNSKGAKGERDAAKALQEWWRRYEPNTVLVRTPRSGGWGKTHSAGFEAAGDVMPDKKTCKHWPFSVEVKWRKRITPAAIGHFLQGKPSPINAHWKQCLEGAVKDKKTPLLVMRGNRMSWHVVFEFRGMVEVMLLDQLVLKKPALVVALCKKRRLSK